MLTVIYVFMIIILIGWNSISGNFVNATMQETAVLAILSESNLVEEYRPVPQLNEKLNGKITSRELVHQKAFC